MREPVVREPGRRVKREGGPLPARAGQAAPYHTRAVARAISALSADQFRMSFTAEV